MAGKSIRGFVSALMREGLPRFVPLVPRTDKEIKAAKTFYRKSLSAFVCFSFDCALGELRDELPEGFEAGIDEFEENFTCREYPTSSTSVQSYVDSHENLRVVYAANTPSEEPRMEFESDAFMFDFRVEWVRQMSAIFNRNVLVATKR